MDIKPTFAQGLSMKEFEYDLPEDKIARFPLTVRDASKLLVWNKGQMQEGRYSGISDLLPSPCTLVFNNSRVMEARIIFQKPSGGQIEIFCLEPHTSYTSISDAMAQTGSVLWSCLIGGASKWKKNVPLLKTVGEICLEARFIEKRADDFIVEFSWTPGYMTFASLLHTMGSVPLPPYLKRKVEDSDTDRYQTVYAKESGSVAAPTAGLHFSEQLLETLSCRNIQSLYLTLHVGAGTFMPVKSEKITDHHMHEEFIEVTGSFIAALITEINKPIIAVGTTSLRTLETLYWLGLKIYLNKHITAAELSLDQWYSYTQPQSITVSESLGFLQDWIKKQPSNKLITRTQLFIVPGYHFKIVKGLITNFHQPQSTLLLLVAAFIGPAWKNAYEWALNNNFRFLSYGDGCLFMP